MNYTKDEWKVKDNGKHEVNIVVGKYNYVLAQVTTFDEQLTNALLIAASPSLYDALKDCITSIETAKRYQTAEHLDGALAVAKEALAKAEGKG